MGKTPSYFSINVTWLAPWERHSMPKEPTPENRSKTYAFFISIENLFEWLIMLNIDSFVRSYKRVYI